MLRGKDAIVSDEAGTLPISVPRSLFLTACDADSECMPALIGTDILVSPSSTMLISGEASAQFIIAGIVLT